MKYFDAQNQKTEKGGTDTTSGAAGSESKQNKGVREGFFWSRNSTSRSFSTFGPKTQNIVKGPQINKMHEFAHFQFLGQSGTKKS